MCSASRLRAAYVEDSLVPVHSAVFSWCWPQGGATGLVRPLGLSAVASSSGRLDREEAGSRDSLSAGRGPGLCRTAYSDPKGEAGDKRRVEGVPGVRQCAGGGPWEHGHAAGAWGSVRVCMSMRAVCTRAGAVCVAWALE